MEARAELESPFPLATKIPRGKDFPPGYPFLRFCPAALTSGSRTRPPLFPVPTLPRHPIGALPFPSRT
jgi:hypothetical protein